MTEQLDELTRVLARLPGLGRRSAERAAMALARQPEGLLADLAVALAKARTIQGCNRCGALTSRELNPCRLCTDPGRDATLLCVVEEPSDILVIERSGGYRGRYHALLGRVSPARHNGPDDMRLRALARRVREDGVREIILALSTDMDGDAGAALIGELLRPMGVKITRLAFGLPADSGVGYSDPVTLRRAIGGRQAL